MRYGNKAFKTFYKKAMEISLTEIKEILPEGLKEAAGELNVYISECFGSEVRIDYGTGHELAFTIFLYCLRELGLYGPEDY